MTKVKRKIIAFCGFEQCVDEKTEYLTEHGWKSIKDYLGEKIGVYKEDGTVNFELPSDFIKAPATEWYHMTSCHGIDQKVSAGHNVYYMTSKNKLRSKSMGEIYENHQSSKSGFTGKFISTFKVLKEGINLPDDVIKLLVVVQAYGTLLKQEDRVSINLKKERKKERLEYLLNKCNIPFTICTGKKGTPSEGYTKYYFKLTEAFKEFPSEWWNCSQSQLELISEEVILWNNRVRSRGPLNYHSDSKNNAEFIQYTFTCVGYKSFIRLSNHRKNVTYRVLGYRKIFTRLNSQKDCIKKEEPYEGEQKYCFTTSSGMWVCRRNYKIAITGNSGKDYSCKRLMTTMGFEKIAFADSLREVAFKTIGFSFDEGMNHYESLKKTTLFNGLNFRNILENLGSAVRRFDKDFWAKSVIKKISETPNNVCISDLRYPNEYKVLKDYCTIHGYDLKLVFCDYKSEGYRDDNPHESAALAKYLKDLGYKDQEYVKEEDVLSFSLIQK